MVLGSEDKKWDCNFQKILKKIPKRINLVFVYLSLTHLIFQSAHLERGHLKPGLCLSNIEFFKTGKQGRCVDPNQPITLFFFLIINEREELSSAAAWSRCASRAQGRDWSTRGKKWQDIKEMKARRENRT